MHYAIMLLSCFFILCGVLSSNAQDLKQLKYRHPGLSVDLGVGLWAWPIPCDADGDGDYDLIVSCPDKPSNGIWLFENGSGATSKNKMPIFKPARRIGSSRHYVMPSYTEEGLRVLTPGYEHPEFTTRGLEKRLILPVSTNFYQPEGPQLKGPRVRHNQWRYVDYDGDGALDLVTGIEDWSFYGWDNAWSKQGEWTNGPLHGFVLVHRNTGSTRSPQFAAPFKVQTDGKPLDVYGCPTPNFVDFDGDGDLDLVCGEFLDGFTYFENVGTRTRPRYSAGHRLRDQLGELVKMDLQMIVPIAFDWDMDGDYDLVVGDEDGRVALVENTGKFHSNRSPVFHQPKYFQQEADTLKCGALATPFGFDWDGDGDMDILSGNTAGYIELFENFSGPGVAEPMWAKPQQLKVDNKPFRILAGSNGSIQGPAEAKWGYTTFSVADWNGDKLPDIVLNSIHGEVMLLLNIGSRVKPQLAAPISLEVEWATSQPELAWGWRKPKGKALLTQWRTTPVVHDLNGDGLPDLIMLDHEGFLAFFERFRQKDELRLHPPRRAFVNELNQPLQLNSKSGGASGRRKICITDWDGDGIADLLVNSRNADWYRGLGYKNDHWCFARPVPIARQNIEGHDVSPTVVDFNGDHIPDFLGGAEDGRFYYFKNPMAK